VDRIEFERVSKRYALGEQRTAREALIAGGRRLAGRRPERREIWSLRDVSFTVADGESVGIVGRNGAGKSTILKVMTGITAPTSGVSRTRGRVAALLEVGTGFHPELTGRENVYLNGAILGMSRRDIGRAFDDIVEFSGVRPFLDTPVKRYSSGMSLRLAFAVAAHLEPDVLVVDEVLAVGDAEFQRKCLGRMEQAEREGRTLVFVSHDLDTLSSLCRRSLWMEAGTVRAEGASSDIVRDYLTSGISAPGSSAALLRSGPLQVLDVRVSAGGRGVEAALLRDDPIEIDVDFELAEAVPGLDLAVYVTTRTGVRVLDVTAGDGGPVSLRPGRQRARVSVPPILNVGTFAVGVWFGTSQHEMVDEPAAATFTLHGSDRGRPDRVLVYDLPVEISPLG
jgi:ABC-type polysaccharide/polyol phosphate transport system ATPase subunit